MLIQYLKTMLSWIYISIYYMAIANKYTVKNSTKKLNKQNIYIHHIKVICTFFIHYLIYF